MAEVKAMAPVDELDEGADGADPTTPEQKEAPSVTRTSGLPPWCKPFPQGFQVPKGKSLLVMRFRAEWTETPHLGERQCVCWGISVREEYLADKRADDSGSRALHEKAKISIRLIAAGDDPTLVPVDPTKGNRAADVDLFWEQIGLRCRSLITHAFINANSLDAVQRRDFYENCVAAVDAV